MSAPVTNSRRPTTGHSGVAWSVGLGLFCSLAGRRLARDPGGVAAGDVVMAAARRRRVVRASQVQTVGSGSSSPGQLPSLAVLPEAVAPVRYGLTLTVAAVMCLLAAGMAGVARRLMLIGSLAVLTLVLYRFAQQSLPVVWLLSDGLGGSLGQLTGIALRRPLVIGASFGGHRLPGRPECLLRRLGRIAAGTAGYAGHFRRRVDCRGAFPVPGDTGIHARYRACSAASRDAEFWQPVRSSTVQLVPDPAADAAVESARRGGTAAHDAGHGADTNRRLPFRWYATGRQAAVRARIGGDRWLQSCCCCVWP